jgi:hypothetical protein
MLSKVLLVSASFLAIPVSCKQESTRGSNLQGLVRPSIAIRKPPLRSPLAISAIKTGLAKHPLMAVSSRQPLAQRRNFQSLILHQILESEGIPRVQLEYVIKDIVADDGNLCGGLSCSRIFSVKENDVDAFLDETEKKVATDARLLKAENLNTRDILIGSLTKQSFEENLLLGEPRTWREFTENIAKNGTKDDTLRSTLVPVMHGLDTDTQKDLLEVIKSHYVAAYKVKFKASSGLAPKRAYDVILRHIAGPERFFKNGVSRDQTMESWRQYFAAQQSSVFSGSDFGSYTPDDVLAVAGRMQEFLVRKGTSAQDVHILLKGSFPAGKANLRKKNPFDNVIDSVMTGFDTSYSDIDFLINADWEKPIKAIEANIYDALVSKKARDLVASSKAKPFFQTHPDAFDLYAELDGSIMSPVGLRINQQSITLVVYKPLPKSELPSREAISRMTQEQKNALYEKWANFYPL